MNGSSRVLVLALFLSPVGKTAVALLTRLAGYLSPHTTQRNSVRNNVSLRQLLGTGTAVEEFGWIDPGLQNVGAFDLNMVAGLEDGIITALAPPWNGGGAAAVTSVTLSVPSERAPMPWSRYCLWWHRRRPRRQPSVCRMHWQSARRRCFVERAPPVVAARASFRIRLAKTYYNEGFFNVPVAFSHHFAAHGAPIKLYCGSDRALLIAVLDRKANQQINTPRIYGKAELAHWIQQQLRGDGFLEVTVIGMDELLLD